MVRIIEDEVAEDPDIFSQENAASLFRRASPAAWRGYFVSLYTSPMVAATAAVNNGCDDHVVSKQMRVGVSTVRRYATLNSNSLKKATNAVFS